MKSSALIVVLDTNVLLSGLVGRSKSGSVPGELMRRWLGGEFELIVSDHILTEIARASTYPYFVQQASSQQGQGLLRRLATRATHVQIIHFVAGIAPDPDDDWILATAWSGSADFLVTGDRGLLSLQTFEGIPIVTPRVFLDILVNPSKAP